MHVITRKRLIDFTAAHPDAEAPLRAWHSMMERATLHTPHEVRQTFPRVSFLGDRRTIFNIAGNRYRLVVDMRYDLGRVYVRRVLTHEEYDRLDATQL